MLSSDQGWNWIERTARGHQRQYYIASLIFIFYILHLLYLILMYNIQSAQLDFYFYIILLDTFILIIYLLIGTQYFTLTMRETFRKIGTNQEYEDLMTKLYEKLEKNFTKSKAYYLLVSLIIISYIFIPPPEKTNFWYFIEPTIWSASIDIFNIAATIFVLYLMTTILWIFFNIFWVLDEIGQESYKNAIKIELFSSDKVGGLKPLANLILYISVYQFIALSLAIINFLSIDSYNEIIFFTTLFLISVYFFINCEIVLKKLLENKRDGEINLVNQLCLEEKKKLMDIIKNKDINNKSELLNQTSKSIELLLEERERLLAASQITFNIRNNFIFLTSSLLPFITVYILPFLKK